MTDDRPLLAPARFGYAMALGLAALLLWTLHSLPVSGQPPRGHRTLLRHASIYDSLTASTLPDQDLLWEDGRIVAQGPGGSLDATAAREVDGKGYCAVPGFADVDSFLSLEGRFPADSVPALLGANLRQQASAGVDAVLDLNAHRSFMQAVRNLDGVLPRTRFAGALFNGPGGWRLPGQTPWDSHVVEVVEVEDIAAPWGRALRFRDEAVFASVEHEGRDGLALPLAALVRLGELAHEQGLPFFIHANHEAKALEALAAKPDALVGPLFEVKDVAGLAAAMKKAGTAYVPSLSTVLNAYPERNLPAWFKSFPASEFLSVSLLASAEDPARAKALAKHWSRQGVDPGRLLAVPAALARAGVTLALGSGSGLPMVYHGLGLQTELAHLRSAGLNNAAILTAATLNSHRLAHLEGGRLEEGARADLMLVAGDPLADLSVLLRPHLVFLGGLEFRP